ncbi:MAG: hypothetical protein JWM96_275 [Alphaproteobacteria bacterium]|nr:hypothetical protein [Alphaproteobacteria bacterium]
MKKLFAVFILILSFAAVSVRAEDEGLYDPVPPPGSAFVRFVNAQSDAKELKPAIHGKEYNAIKQGEVGPYVPAKKGDESFKFGGAEAKESLEEGTSYTVILKGGALAVLKDEAIANQAKAMIAFYNLSSVENLSLKTDDGKVAIIPPVATGKSGYREINAVKVNLAVYNGDAKAADVAPIALRRREPTAVVAMDKEGGTVATQIVQAKTDTTQ